MSISSRKKFKVGIVGTGYIANLHLEALKKIKDVEVVGCCDVNLRKAEDFKKKWAIPFVCNSLVQLLKENQLDVIHILTPPDYHYALAKEIIENRVNVFLEKPMGISSEECNDLVQLAIGNNVQIGVNHNAIFHPLFLRLLRDIAENRIGKISRVVAYQTLPLRQLESGKFSFWMFKSPKNIIFEQAPHPLSQVRALLGNIEEIKTSTSGKRELTPGRFFYDCWQAMAKCENGIAFLHLSFDNQCFPQNLFIVTGQDGTIHIDLLRSLYFIQEKSVLPEYLESWANGLKHFNCIFQGFGNFVNYVLSKIKLRDRCDAFFVSMKGSIEAFYSALIKKERLPVSGKDGCKVVEACEKWVDDAKICENVSQNIGSINIKDRKSEILVTGANGFIGSHLVEKLISEGNAVRVLVRSSQVLKKPLISPFVEIKVGDITDVQFVKEAVKGMKYVYHLAHGGGENWESFYEINVLGTKYLAEACLEEGTKYFIFTSTIAVYYYGIFPKGSLITEKSPIDNEPEKRTFYARSKILAEKMLLEMWREKNLPLIIFRPAIVLGENGTIYHGGIGQWTRDNVCAYWGMGKNELPFVLVEDVASALFKVLEVSGLEGEIFNLVGDVRFSAREYIKHLRMRFQRNVKGFPYPIFLLFLSESLKHLIKRLIIKDKNSLLSYRDLYTRSIPVQFDCSKAKTLLSWEPCSDQNDFIEKAIGWAFNGKF